MKGFALYRVYINAVGSPLVAFSPHSCLQCPFYLFAWMYAALAVKRNSPASSFMPIECNWMLHSIGECKAVPKSGHIFIYSLYLSANHE